MKLFWKMVYGRASKVVACLMFTSDLQILDSKEREQEIVWSNWAVCSSRIVHCSIIGLKFPVAAVRYALLGGKQCAQSACALIVNRGKAIR